MCAIISRPGRRPGVRRHRLRWAPVCTAITPSDQPGERDGCLVAIDCRPRASTGGTGRPDSADGCRLVTDVGASTRDIMVPAHRGGLAVSQLLADSTARTDAGFRLSAPVARRREAEGNTP